ncbi:hypothetical protein FHG89_30630 [Micromonospora orduensis]|uniref:Uncharacterized protein n=1 Tax=Micromonospora orduensis TaxID=1420891 RepID=A0A5C4QEK0_9ACTN|nr:hypothetical protein [Micromonospora orduensis]TNH21813.1 hypothetical protein FHG89_30630 [Micromonospora orduensis]
MAHQPDQNDAAGGPARPVYPHVHVQLSGGNGNAYAIIAAVSRALRRDVGADAAAAFTASAESCGSYDELLQLAMITVDVS